MCNEFRCLLEWMRENVLFDCMSTSLSRLQIINSMKKKMKINKKWISSWNILLTNSTSMIQRPNERTKHREKKQKECFIKVAKCKYDILHWSRSNSSSSSNNNNGSRKKRITTLIAMNDTKNDKLCKMLVFYFHAEICMHFSLKPTNERMNQTTEINWSQASGACDEIAKCLINCQTSQINSLWFYSENWLWCVCVCARLLRNHSLVFAQFEGMFVVCRRGEIVLTKKI